MKYYSTNHKSSGVSLETAVTHGLAADKGLFMPEKINAFPASFFYEMGSMSFQEISMEVARKFFGDDLPEHLLKEIVYDTLSFDTPLVRVKEDIFSLELFHGPTAAFKDVGARFMARLLACFPAKNSNTVHVLVATSGDTGSAVANGFLGIPGIQVHVLYPKGKVSEIQEKQFTTLGQNITALEIDGTFDDCQALVKSAFMDRALREKITLTSANSINVARFLPQTFYYFNAWAKLEDKSRKVVFSVPSGNFGNLTAGLFAKRMGLPVYKFIAANNRNDIVFNYLKTGIYQPRASVSTIANAMDVGDPSNFARILDLYQHNHEAITYDIIGAAYTDDNIRETILDVYNSTNYLLDPHGAVGYRALSELLKDDETGIFLETANPAKFTESVGAIVGSENVLMPEQLVHFMQGKKLSLEFSSDYAQFKTYLEDLVQ